MEKLILVQEILLCIKNNQNYQNFLKDTLLQVQQKLRWIALTRKKVTQKKETLKKAPKRKRVPYHPCYQLLNILKTKIKRQIPPITPFTDKELQILKSLYNKNPNNWSLISSKMNKLSLDCYRNYRRHISYTLSPWKVVWTESEDLQLFEAVKRLGKNNWSELSNWIDGKSSSQCYNRYIKTLNPSIKRGKWQPMEDVNLILAVKVFGPNWVLVSEQIKNRTDIQCRERYCNVLSPSINNSHWALCEDIKLMLLVMLYGKKWSKIARFIKGRTDNQCWRRVKYLIKTSYLLRGLVLTRIFKFRPFEACSGAFAKLAIGFKKMLLIIK
jgi:Myb-like DNA-binding domain